MIFFFNLNLFWIVNEEELNYLCKAFETAISLEPVNYIEYEQFEEIFSQYIPEWNGISGLIDRVFQVEFYLFIYICTKKK